MQKILKSLNKSVGVKGSMVITLDGLVVMSELENSLDKEIVAAMASNTISVIKEALNFLGQKKFDRFILMTAHGRLVFVFVDIDLACLLVVTDKNINIDYTLLEIDIAAHRLINSWKM